jgi:mono/diheme cytochrome c family protein
MNLTSTTENAKRKPILSILGLIVMLLTVSMAINVIAAQEDSTAANDKIYQLQGEYLKGEQGIQVAALGADEFLATVYAGGLPGAGWNRTEPQLIEMSRDDLEDFLAESGAKKTIRQSTTIGLRPPTDATILFDGTEASLTKHWEAGAKIADERLVAGATTKQKFQSYRLHLEFQTPFMPKATGQGRGNSGVYHNGCYETQVLDSFGFPNDGNTCGSIYGVRPADFNATLPPLVWQTYDIEFTAPSWNSDGQKTSPAKLSVWLNGHLIHRDQPVPGPTRAAPGSESPDGGPLYLQDHGNPVHFRNVWIVPFDAKEVASRPRIPAFERFATIVSSSEERSEAGRWLVGELGCQACHQIDSLAATVTHKPAPFLNNAAVRIQADYFAEFLAAPHVAKSGTTMPDLLHGLSDKERTVKVDHLAKFLKSLARSRQRARVNVEAIKRGEELYARIGCAVCHSKLDASSISSTSVPLPNLTKKYILEGLIQFLKNPHSVRPAGRMPGLQLSDEEARDIAHYLLRDAQPPNGSDSTHFKAYHGSWDKLPDFSTLTPIATGKCDGFDLAVAGQANNFAVRFESFIQIDTAGKYRFHLGSDDGSRMLIDDQKVVDVDGIHPHQTSSGEIDLTAGFHHVIVEYFQGGGEWTIACEIEGPNVARQSLDGWLQLEAKPKQTIAETGPSADDIEAGKQAFAQLGCVKCHALDGMKVDMNLAPQAPPLTPQNLAGGCLAAAPPKTAPNYHLSQNQREAISEAILQSQSNEPVSHEQASRQTMATLNCYACHSRNGAGGPESDRLDLFTSSIPEMGEESRLPPLLTGAGDKLTDEYLNQVLRNGDRQRPYMLVRMPQFGDATNALAAHWIASDRTSQEPPPVTEEGEEAEFRTLAAGRQLAGVKGLACVQCHTFGNQKAIGIQAIDLLGMPRRLRPEWFQRYMLHPTQYRPGTRMPASFPDGMSVLTSVYDGNAERQIEALWKFLSQGDQASIPDGLQRNQIILQPQDKPIIYRNFLEGLSARGIAVGYPGGLNLAWDAETMRLAQLWHGQFIDASLHWRDRGVGRQRPLGDHLIMLEPAAPVAFLSTADEAWPAKTTREDEYQFKGYKLDNQGRPTFRYFVRNVEVLDTPAIKLIEGKDPALTRTWTLQATAPETKTVYLRLALGDKIEAVRAGTWKVDNRFEIELNITNSDKTLVRNSNGKQELVIAVENMNTQTKSIQCEIRW